MLTWSVLRLLSSVCTQARSVNSWINISAALANSMGASALIIFTSSSSFIIFFIRASGSACVFKSSYQMVTETANVIRCRTTGRRNGRNLRNHSLIQVCLPKIWYKLYCNCYFHYKLQNKVCKWKMKIIWGTYTFMSSLSNFITLKTCCSPHQYDQP